jgi:glycine cleavage system aminomethyltransferase T
LRTATSPVARTPLHHWHAGRGGRFADRDGWQVVTGYGAPGREADAGRTGLALADVSAGAKLHVTGRGVADLFRDLVPEGSALGPKSVAGRGRATWSACRLSEGRLLLLQAPHATAAGWNDWANAVRQRPACRFTDVTSLYARFCLLGPRLEQCLRRLTHLDVRESSFPVNTCAETSLAGVEGLLVRPSGLAVPSMQLLVAWDMGEYVWERVLEAGQGCGMTAIGLDALAGLNERSA